jgi:hypothetical protein
MANRFEQVDAPVDDAITLIFEQRADGQWAKVFVPKSAHETLSEDKSSPSMPPKDALSSAVRLANEAMLAIVVVDPDGVWKKEWGELYRESGDEETA